MNCVVISNILIYIHFLSLFFSFLDLDVFFYLIRCVHNFFDLYLILFMWKNMLQMPVCLIFFLKNKYPTHDGAQIK